MPSGRLYKKSCLSSNDCQLSSHPPGNRLLSIVDSLSALYHLSSSVLPPQAIISCFRDPSPAISLDHHYSSPLSHRLHSPQTIIRSILVQSSGSSPYLSFRHRSSSHGAHHPMSSPSFLYPLSSLAAVSSLCASCHLPLGSSYLSSGLGRTLVASKLVLIVYGGFRDVKRLGASMLTG